ncbi:MAG: GNAT family N-acetyltransferase [Bacteroidales bacterium]|nr:GNAT family N-acetyltransferase [Bacteroidales bacterium]
MRFHKTIGTIKKGDYYISNVATYESFRKQGMAKTLLMKCEEYCRKEKMSGMVLDVEKHNKGAIHLYENLGYKQTDEYNIKFGDTNLMFLRMKKPVK